MPVSKGNPSKEAQETLRHAKSWAIVGATVKPERYAYQLIQMLKLLDKVIYPINPAYEMIDDLPCYTDLAGLPAVPRSIVLALSPHRTLTFLTEQTIPKEAILWLPPECYDERVVEMVREKKLHVLVGECPLGTALSTGMLGKPSMCDTIG